MKLRISGVFAASTALALLGAIPAFADDSCPAYPTAKMDKIESTALQTEFGAVPAPKKGLHFAYVTKTLINEFWQDVAAGAKAEASKYKLSVDVQAAKDESSMIEQLNLAQTVLSQKPDALLLSPQSDSNLAPVIEAARAANIPTVIIDDARTEGASTYIGTDQVSIGAKAAAFLHQTYPNGGKVAQIEGAAGSPNARLRIQGFKEELKKYPNLELVASQPGNWDRLTALNATSSILRQTPDLVGIYANNDGMALGVVEAVTSGSSLEKVAIVGTDGIREAKKSVGAGEMRATVAEFPFEEGQLGVQMALRLLGCQAIPQWVLSPQAVITKDNVKDFPDPKTN
ncbi:substrate-binding domain-containing protein [Mesorhizobium sp. WSM4976]|uniref:sugar ABC transporter substrate-binding protein n=1 Tax=Mesorhizobium sp. WSM4976 TaxID=3038549 RepID=UPI002417E375|nr:substrate-binding domain-containing protein [Mesorhizobium sp. WSM4976]MDG4898481.1 substrate-binding domain-containing protein [Mesorhizobium sp. WSM4976]